MTHLFYVSYGGDEQGTTLERKLKKIVRQDYNHSVCTEAAVKCIYNRLCRDCETLAEQNPRCKAVKIRFEKPMCSGDGYRILLDRPNGGCGCGSSALLSFRMLASYYLHVDETLFSIADDHALIELSDNLSVYEI